MHWNDLIETTRPPKAKAKVTRKTENQTTQPTRKRKSTKKTRPMTKEKKKTTQKASMVDINSPKTPELASSNLRACSPAPVSASAKPSPIIAAIPESTFGMQLPKEPSLKAIPGKGMQ